MIGRHPEPQRRRVLRPDRARSTACAFTSRSSGTPAPRGAARLRRHVHDPRPQISTPGNAGPVIRTRIALAACGARPPRRPGPMAVSAGHVSDGEADQLSRFDARPRRRPPVSLRRDRGGRGSTTPATGATTVRAGAACASSRTSSSVAFFELDLVPPPAPSRPSLHHGFQDPAPPPPGPAGARVASLAPRAADAHSTDAGPCPGQELPSPPSSRLHLLERETAPWSRCAGACDGKRAVRPVSQDSSASLRRRGLEHRRPVRL